VKNFLIRIISYVLIIFYRFDTAEAVIQGWLPPEDYGEGDSYEIG
tara:strand:- start:400 stop:534 length:135 start_codon:yes stop_codon:yes gene_type:complete